MNDSRQYCTFHLDGLFFGIEVFQIQEVLLGQQMTRVPLAASTVSGLINLRGQIVTALDLRRRLGLAPLPEDREPMNVVVRDEDSLVSLLVDEIGDVVNVDESTFEAPPENVKGVARELTTGVYKLDGRLLLILDLAKALQTPGANARRSPEHEEARAAA
ncbi:MAG: chemotaxis protein CheW [Candidatus Eisenbacteria bacterium]|jgi:purine-binding chemotaxis protein CheW|nr:chemotaxis protein CheW [Candidatus Eisenbacteria bacterium]